jgi:hypothetical protein
VTLDAAAVVTNCLRTVEPSERFPVLQELLVHTAAAMEVLKGTSAAAAEEVYRLADAIVTKAIPS